jgi:diaminopimelate decarboxylase
MASTATDTLTPLLTPTDYLSADETGLLWIDGCSAQALLEEFGSPLFVISERTLRANYRRVHAALSSAWPKPVNVLYAIKANNNLAVRAILHQEGAGGDCFGEGELYATFMGGADPRKIVMNGASKTEAELRAALQAGVAINVDSEDEIELLAALSGELGIEARVALRLRTLPRALAAFQADYFSDELSVLDVISEWPWGFSFEDAARLVPHILATPGLVLEGYHSHFGRGNPDPEYYAAWATALAEHVVALRERTGYAPAILDVGGGYARERDPESGLLELGSHTTEDYIRAAAGALRSTFEAADMPLPELWMEPGRAIIGNAGVLLGAVGAVRRDLGKVWVNADFSENQLLNAGKTVEYHILAASRLHEPPAETVHIMSPLCAGVILGAQRSMPRLQRGDLLAVLDAGMYAESQSRQFNGQPRPATVLVRDGRAEVIKERESVLDVFARHRVPERLRG